MDASFHQLDDAKARALHLLTCPLCTQQYEDPRVLPCQHTFCCRCLLAHVDRDTSSRARTSSSRPGAFSCPVCLADVGLPAAGASAFPVDQRIRNIRDLVVEEMAKGLASRFKGRLHADGVCNGGDGSGLGGDGVPGRRTGVSAATRLGNISEQPGIDDSVSDEVDGGTWPSSHRRFVDESACRTDSDQRMDEPVFSRQRPGYSSVRGGSRARSSRTETPSAKSFEDSGQFAGEPDPDPGINRNVPGYFSLRAPRTRRAGVADTHTQSMYDSIGRYQGRTMPSSGCSDNGHASSVHSRETGRNTAQRPSSYVEVSSNSSPFDNLNRDDDMSEPYTPIIGRNRLAYFSLRERRRRPAFDPDHLYNSPADFVDEESRSSDGPRRFGNHDSRFTHNHRSSDVRSETHSTAKFGERLQRTVSDDQNWTSEHNAGGQKLPENNHEYENGKVRTSDNEYAARNRTEDLKSRLQQRPDNLDISGLTVLSNLPAEMKATVIGKVSKCTGTSGSDHSPLRTQLDNTTDEVGHHINASESPIMSCTSDEVPSVSHTQNDVTSQLNERCDVDLGKTDDDDVNSTHTEPMTLCSTDTGKDSKPNDASPSAPDMFTAANDGRSTENTDAVDQQYSSSHDGKHSPVHSPDESCFSRLTKFRTSKNSRQATSFTNSTADSMSKEAESPSPSLDETDANDVPIAKPRVRKRPPVFVGTALFTASGLREDLVTSPPSVVTNDELSSESVSCNKEHVQSEQHIELHPASVNGSTVDNVCSDSMSFSGDVRDGADVEEPPTRSCDVSPTVDTTGTTESTDVQSAADDVPSTQSRAQHQPDDDSAVYSAGLDSDASLRSATEPCLPTPSTDDDDDLDSVLVKCDELTSTTLANQQGVQTDDITYLDHGCGLSESHPADGVTTDFNVEHHREDVELISQVHESEAVENGDAKDGDSGNRSSDELCNQHGQPPQSDDAVDEDDVTPMDEHGDSNSGCRTSQQINEADEVADDHHSSDGYLMATGLAALGDGSLVVADYGAGCVCLCDAEGRADHRVTGLKPFSVATSPWSNATVDDDHRLIYVGDRRRKTLVVLDQHGCDVAQWPDNQFDWICGIACLPDGQLAVLDRSRTRQLGIYPTSGDDARPLTELGGQGSSLGDLCMAQFVAADSRGRVLVADSANHCVKAFDRRVSPPGVVAVYGTTRGSGDAQLEWPKGVAVDSADNVLVADCRNGRVVAFSVDGRPLGCVVPAVRGPFAICTIPTSLSDCGRLAVTTYSVNGLSEFRLHDYHTAAIFV